MLMFTALSEYVPDARLMPELYVGLRGAISKEIVLLVDASEILIRFPLTIGVMVIIELAESK